MIFPGWLTGTVRRWLAVTGTVSTIASGIIFAASNERLWAWITIGFLASWIPALGWTARTEHNLRTVGENVEQAPDAQRLACLRTFLTAAIREGRQIFRTPEGDETVQWAETWANRTVDVLEKALGPTAADRFRSDRYGTSPGAFMTGSALVSKRVSILEFHLRNLGQEPIMEDWRPQRADEP